MTKIEQELRGKIAELIEAHEVDKAGHQIRIVGCILQFGDKVPADHNEFFEWNGQEFQPCSPIEHIPDEG